jgi:hypothetical protein
MKKLIYCFPQSRIIKKNSESKFIINFLFECTDPNYHILITCTDTNGNIIEEVFQLTNTNIYLPFDCTDIISNETKKIKYTIYNLPNPDNICYTDLESYGFITVNTSSNI